MINLYIFLSVIIFCGAISNSFAAIDAQIDKDSGKIVVRIRLRGVEKQLFPIIQEFKSDALDSNSIFGGFWTIDLIDSLVKLKDKNNMTWRFRNSASMDFVKSKESENIFFNAGWRAEIFNRSKILITSKGDSRVSFIYRNGKLEKEVTPFYSIDFNYDVQSGFVQLVKNEKRTEIIKFKYTKIKERFLVSSVLLDGEVINFEYGNFDVFTDLRQLESRTLLKQIKFERDLVIDIKYYGKKDADNLVNGAEILYTTKLCTVSRNYEWDAVTAIVRKINDNIYDVKIKNTKDEKLESISIFQYDISSNLSCIWA